MADDQDAGRQAPQNQAAPQGQAPNAPAAQQASKAPDKAPDRTGRMTAEDRKAAAVGARKEKLIGIMQDDRNPGRALAAAQEFAELHGHDESPFPGGRYARDGNYVNAEGKFIDAEGKEVAEPVEAAAPVAPPA